ncbi:MAG: hypothetical protein AAF125_26560, partial [Chloroflexota bacterium]
MPFQAWRDAVRRLLLIVDASDKILSVLKSIVPDLGALVGRVIPDAPTLTGKAETERIALAIVALLEDYFAQDETQPLLLQLNDVQWGGDTLTPIPYLLPLTEQNPFVLMANYRSDERPNLANEFPQMQSMQLERLDNHAVRELMASMVGASAVTPEFVAFIHQQSEGNTYFVVEVLRALAEEAGTLHAVGQVRLPTSVLTGGIEALAMRRYDRLPAASQPVMQYAAIIGRALDTDLLADILPTTDIAAALNSAGEAAVLEVEDNQWRFSHDKLRETLLKQLPADGRQAMYEQVARAASVRYPDDDHAAQNARYWLGAGNHKRAVEVGLRMVNTAIRTANFRDIADLLGAIVKQLPQGNTAYTELPTNLRAQLYNRYGMALEEL